MKTLLQASAVTYRLRDAEPEFLLITSAGGRWIFPKGIIDPGETSEETALKEAREEAGVRGRIVGPPLGRYAYEKWGSRCEVLVHLMEVEAEEADWPERLERQRAWFRYREAREAIDKKKVLAMLDLARDALSRLTPDR